MPPPAPAYSLLPCLAALVVVLQDPLDRYRLAVGLAERGMHERAAAECEAFLRETPDHEKAPHVRYRLGQSLYELKKWKEASDALGGVVGKGFEFDAEARFRRGQCLLELGRNQDAAAAFATVGAERSDHYLAGPAIYFGAEARFRAGEFERAAKGYAQLLERFPQSEYRKGARYGLGWSRFKAERFGEAAEALRAFLGEHPRDALAPEVSYLLGECLMRLDRPAEAADAYARVGSGDFADDAAVARAAAMEKAGDGARAVEAYLAAAKAFPESPRVADALVGAGSTLLAANRAADALRPLEAAAARDGARRPEAIALLGLALVRAGRPADALPHLDALLREPIPPEVARRARLARADALGALGRNAEAASEYESAGSPTEPDFAPAAAVVARLKGGDAAGAAEGARAFLAKFPTSPRAAEVRVALGEALFTLGSHAEAADAFEPVARGNGEAAATAASRLAWCRYLAGDRARAAQAFAAFLARFPDHSLAPEARTMEGRSRLESGDAKGAKAAFEAALAKGAGPFEAEALLGLARACAAAGDPEETRRRFAEFERRAGTSPLRPRGLYEHAEFLYRRGEKEAAAAKYEALVREFAGDELAPHARFGLAWCRLDAGDGKGAARLAREVLAGKIPADLETGALELLGAAAAKSGAWDDARDAYREVLARNPSGERAGEVALGEATANARAGRHEEARRSLEALASDPRAAKVRDRVLYELAFARAAVGDDAAADQAFARIEREFAATPGGAEAPFHRGEIAYRAKRFADAEGHYARARDERVRGKALYKLGWSRLEQGKNEEAAAAFDEAASAGGALEGESLFLAGEALYRARRFEPAVERLRTFRERHADHEMLPQGLFRLGSSLGEGARWDGCLEALEELGRRFPRFENRPEADLWVGRALRAKGKRSEARRVLERVVETGGDLLAARARIEIAGTLSDGGDRDGALAEFLKVAILYSHEDEVAASLLGAADCLAAMGEGAKADARLREIVDRFPRHPLAGTARKRLESSGRGPSR